jgi:hypothetical protein
MTRRKAHTIAAVTAFLGAFVPTLVALKMLADNNNNNELFDSATGRWDVGYALGVSAVLYVPAFLFIYVIAFGLTSRPGDDVDH